MAELARLVEWIETSRATVALTGAGVSTESGIPDFRSDSGLWGSSEPMQVASIDGFLEDPVRFYRFWSDKFAGITQAKPNAVHHLLVGLESRGRMQAVITQNIDGLHQKAGSRCVLEVHGSFRKAACLVCHAAEPIESVMARGPQSAAICQSCGAVAMKPGVVLFGESLPDAYGKAERAISEAELLLVMGTSLAVQPVAGFVPLAKRRGARVAILNREPTPFDTEADVTLHAELGTMVRSLTAMLNLG